MPSLFTTATTASSGLSLTVTANSESAAQLSWNAIANAVSYEVKFSFDGVLFDQGGTVDTASTTATIDGIDPEMPVFCKVLVNSAGFTDDAEAVVTLQSNTAGATTFAATPDSYVSPNSSAESGQRLVVAWYGIDSFNTLSPGDWRIESITDVLGGTVNSRDADNDSRGEAYKFDKGRRAVTDLLRKIDGAGSGIVDHVITPSEVSAVHVDFIAFSWGTITAVNESRKLSSARNLYGYTLTTAIPIETMVLLDPINQRIPRIFRGTHGPILPNVKKFRNYYETKGGTGTIHYSSNPFGPFDTNYTIGGLVAENVRGHPIANAALDTIETDITIAPGFSTVNVSRLFRRNPGDFNFYFGRARGNEMNHSTLPWYVAERALIDIDPSQQVFPPDQQGPFEDFQVATAEQ